MKSRIAPNTSVFQLEVQDFKHRQHPPINVFQTEKNWKKHHDIEDYIPVITLFRRAKRAEQAIKSASKRGSVISCQKVDSHLRRLDMISHLYVAQKPIEVEISVDEFIIGRDLEISPTPRSKKMDVEALDK